MTLPLLCVCAVLLGLCLAQSADHSAYRCDVCDLWMEQRSGALGGLYNAVFLISMAFFMAIEAFQRFFAPEEIEQPNLVLIVSTIGLLFNFIARTLP
ncbi:cation efflux protein [Kipferlia bialata]|uniref:Cation efflux protein n=1 Tax=Kipferlia bialata TaxID=797122 RepID=A0A9K3CNZ0_9EUKA|nr:cation efflux protein [Kipferlia bialata]|eukprot:g246.t1